MQLPQLPIFSINTETLQISIPYEMARFAVSQRILVSKYETNQVIRALDTWLILKHETTSGILRKWNRQKTQLLKLCKCSETILRHRLQILNELKLITRYKVECKNDSIKICSWEQLGSALEIDTKERLIIQYNTNDKQTIHQWLIATEIEDNKRRQDYSIARKLRVNAEAKMLLDAALIKAGADCSKLNDLQYYLMWMRILYSSDFNRLSEAHNELIEIRPDNNRSVKGIANSWNCKHPVTISYWKKILQRNKIINVDKIQIESAERARNPYCKVLWLKKSKQTLLCLCDQITLLKPWDRMPGLQIFAAA